MLKRIANKLKCFFQGKRYTTSKQVYNRSRVTYNFISEELEREEKKTKFLNEKVENKMKTIFKNTKLR